MRSKFMRAVLGVLGIWFGVSSDAMAEEGIYKFELSGNQTNRIASVGWFSEQGAGYVVETAETVEGNWNSVLEDDAVYLADDFLSNYNIPASNATQFFRVRKIDVQVPKIEFVTPAIDEFAVPVDSELSISLSDESGIDPSSVTLYIDGGIVDSSLVTVAEGMLRYAPPSGVLGTNGQELAIMVVASDRCGNWASATSTIRLATPLTVVAKSVLCVGDPAEGESSYKLIDGTRVDSPTIVLVDQDEGSMTFAGGTASDFQRGQILASMMPSNAFRKKVVSVSTIEGGLVRVETEEALLSELYSGSFSTSGNGQLPYSSAQKSLRAIHVDDSFDKSWTVGEAVTAHLGVDKTIQFSLESSLRYYGKWRVNGDIGIGGNTDFTIDFDGDFVLTDSAMLTCAKSISKTFQKKIPLLKSPNLQVAPGIFVKFTVSIDARLELKAEGGIDFKYKTTRTFPTRVHRSYKNGEWKKYDDEKMADSAPKKESDPAMNFEATGCATLSLGPRLDIKVDSFIGPYIYGGGFVRAERKIEPTAMTDRITAGKFLEIGINAKFKGDMPMISWERCTVLYEDEKMARAPKILDFPSDMCVAVGSRINLSPYVEGTGPISYFWQKNGAIISMARSLSFDATKNTAGTYKLTASNFIGIDTKSVVIDVEPTNSLEPFVGTWRQRATSTEWREFHIRSTGGGYFQLVSRGILRHSPSDYPLTCTVINGGIRIARHNYYGEDTVYTITLVKDGEGVLAKHTGDLSVGVSTAVRRVSRDP